MLPNRTFKTPLFGQPQLDLCLHGGVGGRQVIGAGLSAIDLVLNVFVVGLDYSSVLLVTLLVLRL